MDHLKIVLPKLKVKNKMIFNLHQLPITSIGMIAHGQVDETFVEHSNKFGPMILTL
jgi:hypothetical protein